jgi:hypothetical protein
MSYIIKNTSPFVSIKLTQSGRELLSQGKLTFSYWAIGDSEINYERESIIDGDPISFPSTESSVVMRPLDRQPKLKSFIYPSTSNDYYKPINGSVLNVVKVVANNEATERGFFQPSGSTFITKTDSDFCLYNQFNSNPMDIVFSGTNKFTLSSSAVTIGDLVLVKYGPSNGDVLIQNSNNKPLQNLFSNIYL